MLDLTKNTDCLQSSEQEFSVEKQESEKKTMGEELVYRATDHVTSGIEDIIGKPLGCNSSCQQKPFSNYELSYNGNLENM